MHIRQLPSERVYPFRVTIITALISSLVAASVTYAITQQESGIRKHYLTTSYVSTPTGGSDQAPSQSETLKWLKSKISKDYTSVNLEFPAGDSLRIYAETEMLSDCDVSIVAYNAPSDAPPSKTTWTFPLVEVAIFADAKAYKDFRSAEGAGAVVFRGRDGKAAIQTVVSTEGEGTKTWAKPSVSKIKQFMIPFASSTLAERVTKAFEHARAFCFSDATREPF